MTYANRPIYSKHDRLHYGLLTCYSARELSLLSAILLSRAFSCSCFNLWTKCDDVCVNCAEEASVVFQRIQYNFRFAREFDHTLLCLNILIIQLLASWSNSKHVEKPVALPKSLTCYHLFVTICLYHKWIRSGKQCCFSHSQRHWAKRFAFDQRKHQDAFILWHHLDCPQHPHLMYVSFEFLNHLMSVSFFFAWSNVDSAKRVVHEPSKTLETKLWITWRHRAFSECSGMTRNMSSAANVSSPAQVIQATRIRNLRTLSLLSLHTEVTGIPMHVLHAHSILSRSTHIAPTKSSMHHVFTLTINYSWYYRNKNIFIMLDNNQLNACAHIQGQKPGFAQNA